MIISEEYKFIFVHVPKTAGLSVKDAFRKYGRPKDRTIWRSISRRLPFYESPSKSYLKGHDPARKMIAKLSRPIFDDFLSFAVVRNPFDHAVSHYEYMKQFRIKSTAEKVGKMSFQEYLENRVKAPFLNNTIFARMPDQSYYLVDKFGKIAVKRIIKFENLNSELEQLGRDLALPSFELRHVNKTKASKKPLQDYYSDVTVDLVKKIYNRDFDLIGYSRDIPNLN